MPPTSHQWLKPALTLEDNLLTWDADPRGSTRRLLPRRRASAHGGYLRKPAIGAFAVAGLLGDQGDQKDGYQPGANFQEDMRRRRAGLLTAPPEYYDQERTF